MRNFQFLLILLSFLVVSTHITAQDVDDLQYEEQIKPLLRKRCFACHGALKQESGLRVDTVAAMNQHAVIASGELLERLGSSETDYRMPPEGEPLSEDELKLFNDWIKAGAPAPEDEQAEISPAEHWAFQRITRPAIPASTASNPIDAFLQSSQESQGLKRQRRASRHILLRRLYLDLVGLPPTPQQLRSEQSVAEIIDQLLSSPHYGERWGRHWMDVWRYSDWYGLNAQLRNSQKHIWHWREWIIQSLNADKGYDQMIREMLAGDELDPDNPSTLAATGFLARNYYLFNRTTWLDDTIEHTSKAFLGLTMNCCKCHDHKYDPISNEDYYRFRAIFEPHHVRLDALPGETDFERDGLPRVYDDNLTTPTYIHERGNPANPDKSNVIQPGTPSFLADFAIDPKPIQLPVESWAPGVRPFVQSDQLAKARTKVKKQQEKLLALEQESKEQLAAESEKNIATRIADDFTAKSPKVWQTIGSGWEYRNGKLVQSKATMARSCIRSLVSHPRDFELTVKFRTTGGAKWKSAGVRFDADTSGENAHTVYASAYAAGPKVQVSHCIAGKNSYPAQASVRQPIKIGQEYELNVKIRDNLLNVTLDGEFLLAYRLPHRREGSIELFAFDAVTEFDSIAFGPLPESTLLKEAESGLAKATDSISLVTAELHLAKAELVALEAQIAADNAKFLGQGKGSEEESSRSRLLADLAEQQLALLKASGNAKKKIQNKVKQLQEDLESVRLPPHQPLRGSQRALNQGTHKHSQYSPIYPRTSTGRRTALAKWMTHRDNPLTARVAVNHIWTRHFGAPLVESSFDFGRRSPTPKHRELLDFLAMELIESDWSMKHVHRMILNSDAWQQSSSNLNADSSTLERDPNNHFYWRMNPQRMTSQALRDSLLHLSRKLDLTLGGPSIKPNPSVVRRSIYLVHALEERDKFVSTFDDANVLGCYRRTASIVPQQALALMNSREAIEAADAIAARLSTNLADTDFIKGIFRELLARQPSAEELELCIDFLREQNKRSSLVLSLLNHNDFQVIR